VIDYKRWYTATPKSPKGDFGAVFDILCTTQADEHFIVEMQLGEQTYFRDRALFYASHAIRKQAPRKQYWNYELKGVYVVSI